MGKWLLVLFAIPLWGQSAADWKTVLDRLDKLERENVELREQVKTLAVRLGEPSATAPAPPPTLEERVAIQEARTSEQAQVKVESSHRFPIRLTGMALFNTYLSGPNASGDIFTTAAPTPSRNIGGGTFRQSIIGIEYFGPTTFGGGQIRGNLFMDFFGGFNDNGSNPLRIRTANMEIDWKTRTFAVGLEKAIFAPREPTSLAIVGVSPLTSAGNLWRWQPQVRFEQRIALSDATDLTAQVGLIQTAEDSTVNGLGTPVYDGRGGLEGGFERRRPGLEGRFEVAHRFSDTRRIEIAPGFHVSDSHVLDVTVPSRIFSGDWLIAPFSKLEFTGAFFKGENVQHLGALRQGVTVLPNGRPIPVHSVGGWGQLAFNPGGKLMFHLMAGVHDDRSSDLAGPQRIGQNRIGAANIMYRLAPNVVGSFEVMNVRTNYLGLGWRLQNRLDLALAYQF